MNETVEERCHQLLDYWRAELPSMAAGAGEQLTPLTLEMIASLAAALNRFDYEAKRVLDRG